MSHLTVTFGKQNGLQSLSNRLTQRGLLEATNVDVERPNVLRKRPGEQVLSLNRSSADPTDLIPTEELRALWARGTEVVLETDRELYSWQRCASGASGAVTSGTATPGEISDALEILNARADQSRNIDVPLPGDADAGVARARAGRPEIPPPLEIVRFGLPPREITITITETAPGSLAWTATEGATVNGPNALPLGGLQRVARLQDLALVSASQDVLLTYIGDGILRGLVMTLEAEPAEFSTAPRLLGNLRGAPANCWYESRQGAISAFMGIDGGDLRVYDATNVAISRVFVVANPPPTTGAYSLDHTSKGFSPVFPSLPMAVCWLGSDNLLSSARLDVPDELVVHQASAPNQRDLPDVQVGIEPQAAPPLGNGFLVAVAASAMIDRPVTLLDVAGADDTMRVVDLDGAELRLALTGAGSTLLYTLRNASSNDEIGNTTDTDLAATDSQFVVNIDQVFGGSLAAGDLHEHRWLRSYSITTTLVPSSNTAQAFAVAQSASRLLLAWWIAGDELIVRSAVDIESVTNTASFTWASTYTDPVVDMAAPVAICVLSEAGAIDYTARVHSFSPSGEYLSGTADNTAPSDVLLEQVSEPWAELPVYTSSSPAGTPPRAMFGAQFLSTSQEIWEDDIPLFVRVSPPLVVPAGGEWVTRGPWSRTLLRSSIVRRYERGDVVSSDAAAVINDDGQVCIFNAVENSQSPPDSLAGAQADVVSTHTEGHIVIDANGSRPRVSTYDRLRAYVTYLQAGGDLVSAIWSPGQALSFSAFGATPSSVDTWDQTAGVFAGAAVACVAWDRSGGGGQLDIYVSPEGGAPFTFTRLHPYPGATRADVAVFLEETDTGIYLAWAIAGFGVGGGGFFTGLELLDTGLGTATPIFSRSLAGLLDQPAAVAVGRHSDTETAVWLELVQGANRRVLHYTEDGATDTLVRTELRTALVSQLARLGGDLVGVESLLDVVGDITPIKTVRNGLVMRAHTSGQIVGRVGIGDVEDAAERVLRPPHTGLNVDLDGRLVLGWQETTFTTDTDSAPTSSVYVWDPNVGAHNPAVLDNIAVAAHGGYPRMADGQDVHEHDWHHLPELLSALTAPGGGSSLGSYRIALTWEDTDAQGFLYRSRPSFFGPFPMNANDKVDVAWRGLTHTERTSTRAVLWRTIADGDSFRREAGNPAVLSGDVQLTTLTLTDNQLLTREVLDQGASVVASDPIAITDFTALANGRIWSRDPRDGKVARFSLVSRAFAASRSHVHWNLAYATTHTGSSAITAMAEMDARIIMLGALDVSALYGDGPDNSGGGTAYNTAARVPVDIGAVDHSTLAVIPEGLVYGAGPGVEVQLLTRGYVSAPLSAQIPRLFQELGQNVVAAVYRESTDTLYLLDDGIDGGPTATLRYNTATQRWANDSLRQGQDLARLDNGELFILTTDGRVIFEDLTRYDSGGQGYIASFRTPWISSGALSQPLNIVKAQIFGTYEGSHALTIDVRYNYEEAIRETATIPASDIDAHAEAGQVYAYEHHAGLEASAVSYTFRDGGEPNATFCVEQVAIDLQPSGNPAGGQLGDGHSFAKVPS